MKAQNELDKDAAHEGPESIPGGCQVKSISTGDEVNPKSRTFLA